MVARPGISGFHAVYAFLFENYAWQVALRLLAVVFGTCGVACSFLFVQPPPEGGGGLRISGVTNFRRSSVARGEKRRTTRSSSWKTARMTSCSFLRRFFSLRLRRAALSSEDEEEELRDAIVALLRLFCCGRARSALLCLV